MHYKILFTNLHCKASSPAKSRANPPYAPPVEKQENTHRMTTTTTSPETHEQAAESPWAVETHGLTKRFGENVAVNGVELLVPRGCAFGYLGPNGAGKTTLIRVLLGLTRADAGTMSLLGHRVPLHRDKALARVGAIVDEPRFHGHLTGRQNLQILAAAREPAARDRIGAALERVGILHRADDKVSKYSMGMRQRLGVAACLIGDPQLLILDEPMNGLDPAGMQDMRAMILSLVAEGRTVVLSSHLLDEVERTCDAVAIVDRGSVVRQGPISELLAGTSLVLQVDCSDPDRARRACRRHCHRHWGWSGCGDRDQRSRHHPAGRDGTRRDRGDQSCARRRWDLGLPTAGDPGIARIVVPTGHEPTGGIAVTTLSDVTTAGPERQGRHGADRRGSFIPSGAMIATRIMELRKRRGLMITLFLVTVGIPTVFVVIRLLLHAFAPKTYGPAGGYDLYTAIVSGVLYVFGFIVAATLGATAGSADLSEGMFRHLVVTGRSRLAIYLARIPAGLAILIPLVAAGFIIVCAVCVFAAPTTLNYDGVHVPAGLTRTGFANWASDHGDEVICNFGIKIGPNTPNASTLNAVLMNVPCNNGPGGGPANVQQSPGPGGQGQPQPSPAQISEVAREIAQMNYSDYARQFLYPSDSLMIKSGLWLELEAVVGFVVGLGLGSLIGQRTVAVIVMIVLEVILTPILSMARIPHLSNLQRAVVGLAVAHLTPGGLPVFGGGGGGPGGGAGNPGLLPESTTVAICVIVAWLVGWTIVGAWRMMRRDA